MQVILLKSEIVYFPIEMGLLILTQALRNAIYHNVLFVSHADSLGTNVNAIK